jgi:hypothetical protein
MSTPWKKMDHRTQYANIIHRNGRLLVFYEAFDTFQQKLFAHMGNAPSNR